MPASRTNDIKDCINDKVNQRPRINGAPITLNTLKKENTTHRFPVKRSDFSSIVLLYNTF